MSKLKELQEKIGYTYENEGLLRHALTHSSYANEKRMKKGADNERLEFLGDAVLEIVTSEFLYHKYPNRPEGELTKIRASLVCEPTLADCTKELSLGNYLYLGKGEDRTGGRKRPSILSDALEAVIGSLYLDGGLEIAKAFILRFILTDTEKKQLFYDSKTILQEILQKDFKERVEYVLTDEYGPDHDKHFKVDAVFRGQIFGSGEGKTKKRAEQQAAYEAILKLKNSEIPKEQ